MFVIFAQLYDNLFLLIMSRASKSLEANGGSRQHSSASTGHLLDDCSPSPFSAGQRPVQIDLKRLN